MTAKKPASPIRPASARVVRSRPLRSPGKTKAATPATKARRPKASKQKLARPAPTIPADLEILSTTPAPRWRALVRKSRRLVAWILLAGVVVIDPGLVLAVFLLLVASALSLFTLGVIATALTTVALLNHWWPGRYGRILRRPSDASNSSSTP